MSFILKQGNNRMPVTKICRKAGIGQPTYFNWKKKYDALLPDADHRRYVFTLRASNRSAVQSLDSSRRWIETGGNVRCRTLWRHNDDS